MKGEYNQSEGIRSLRHDGLQVHEGGLATVIAVSNYNDMGGGVGRDVEGAA